MRSRTVGPTLVVSAGMLCLTVLLLTVQERLLWRMVSTASTDPLGVFEALRFTIDPYVVMIVSFVAATLARNRTLTVAMVGIVPVYIRALLIRQQPLASQVPQLIGDALLCLAIASVTARVYWRSKTE